MAIPPEELARYKATAHERARTAQEELAQRLTHARKVAASAAALLKAVFAVERVVVFGSLVHPELFHIHSDLDLAVWGLQERDYLRALGQLQGLDPAFAIDLIRVEEAPAPLCATILQEGQAL